jgi:circadian clock protein KaiC
MTKHAQGNAVKTKQISALTVLPKVETGIAGFDDVTDGGLPRGRTTLLVGGPGSGKTIFALQFVTHGALACDEPGIFVAFEETSTRILANAQNFGWKLDDLVPSKLFFLDAQPMAAMVQSGSFDLGGMLAALEVQVKNMGARRIVFDALDIVLSLLPDGAAKRREIYRLHEWLLANGLTGLITAKAGDGDGQAVLGRAFGVLQFMVDCAVILNHSVVEGVSQRNLRVQKYRGSSFEENETPFLIGPNGLEVAVSRTVSTADPEVTNERVSSGVARLDTMLGGGYYRGAMVLITGFPGTAKTTLSGAFAEAACARGERTMFVSYDSDGAEVIRNLASVGIRLNEHVESGLLRIVSARTINGSAETYLVRIKSLAEEHGARCLVVDPVSSLSKSGNALTANSVVERLIHWSKAQGMTLICTSLLDEMASQSDGASTLRVSTLADTWIHLNYLVQAGERNRGMSIIKSRGTAHSNQVRELILSENGVTLTDTYSAGGEVLMGTLRWEKERAERAEATAVSLAAKLKELQLDAEEAELAVRLKSLETELLAKQAEKALLVQATQYREQEYLRGRSQVQELRGADQKVQRPA